MPGDNGEAAGGAASDTGLQLPGDFLKAEAVPFRREVLTCGDAGEDRAVEERHDPATWLAAFAALGCRYSQQPAFDLEVTSWTGRAAAPAAWRVSMRVTAEDTAGALRERAAAALAPGGSPPARRYGVPGSLPVALRFLPGDGDFAADLARETVGEYELQVVFAGGVLRAMVYDGRIFVAATIERLTSHLRQVLAGGLADPSCAVARLPLLLAAEREQLSVGWRSGRYPYPQLPAFRYVEAHARERPEALAVSFNQDRLTYGELDRRANQLARALRDRGVAAGARIAVCIHPSADIAVAILAIHKLGACHVPLDPAYPVERLGVIIDDVRPEVIVAHSTAADSLPPHGLPVVLLDRERERLAALPAEPPGVEVGVDQPAFIVYTSGTTGKPKGVVMSHANLIHYVLSARDRYRFGPEDVFPAAARFTFSITLFEVLLPLVAGGRVIVLERDHVLDFARLTRTLHEVTAVHFSPSLWRKVVAYLRDQKIAPDAFPNLRHVSSGGDLVSADLIEELKRRFTAAEVFVIYGCSEIACMGCTYFAARGQTVTRSLVGAPFDNMGVRLTDPQGNQVPIGVAGEILFSGAGVALGYLNRPELTGERFVLIDGERYYRTGDLGRYDGQGNIEILGRSDYQIKLRGIRIELGEVETTLRQAPGVREAVCAARALGGDEKSLVAYLVPTSAGDLDLRAVRRFLQGKLPDYMVPAAYVVLEAMPVNMNNKLDRAALPAPTAADLARLRSFDPPRNDAERKLVAIWEDVLQIRPIGIRDSFFDIGGDSLQSVSLMVEIEKAFGKTLPLSSVLTEPTIEQVAARLTEHADQPQTNVIVLREGTGGLPIFFVHDGEGEIIPYRNLARRLNPAHTVYGLQPVTDRHHPMLHTRLADVVDAYAARIRELQPTGPYLLSGLCIGGFIAFEIARKLQREGGTIGAVLLIDAAHVTAHEKSLATRRFKRFSAAVTQPGMQASLPRQLLDRVRKAAGKATNLLRYEIRTRVERRRQRLRMQIYRFCLDHQLPLPELTNDIPVRVVLRFAEKEYVTPAVRYPGEVALFKATRKDPMFDGTLIDDTPYTDMFVDPQLEWEDKVERLDARDMPGGHSSMLIPPYVEGLAAQFQAYIDGALAPQRSDRRAA